MRRLAAAIVVLPCACGRVGFDAVDDAIDAVSARPCVIDATTIFCDDFEQPDLTRWSSVTRMARVGGSLVHAGSGAAQGAIVGTPDNASLTATLGGAQQLPQLFVRAWFYVTAASSLGHVNLLTVQNGADHGLTFLAWNGLHDMYRITPGEDSYDSAVLIARERWTCIELDIVVDNAAGSFELRADGAVLLQAGSIDTLPDGGYDEIDVGLPYSEGPDQGAATIYVDDVYVATSALGCVP